VSLNPQLFPNLVADEITELKRIASKISDSELKNLFHILIGSEDEINRSGFPKIIFEILLLKLVNYKSLLSLEEIASKLEKLSEFDYKENFSENSQHISHSKEKVIENKVHSYKTESMENFVQANEEVEENKDIFIDLIKFIRREKPPLGALLSQGKLVKLDQKVMKISFPKDSIYVEQIKENEKTESLINYCKEFFNKSDFKVEIDAVKKTFDKEIKIKEEDTNIKETLNNQIISKAINLFQGSRIEEIKKL
jgi:DNA polymerase III gamma/tau subunit